MAEFNRRHFIKMSGIVAGAAIASSMLPSRLRGKDLPLPSAAGFDDFFKISNEEMKKLLEAALSKGGDFSELYFEYRISSSATMEEDIIKSSSESISLGVGIRVLKGEQTGYAFTNDLTFDKIRHTALTAAAIASGNSKLKIANLNMSKPFKQIYDLNEPLSEADLETKLKLIREAYDSAKKADNRIIKVSSYLADELQYITIANSDGIIVSDIRPQARLGVTATALDKGVKNTGSWSDGGRIGLDYFKSKSDPKKIGAKAAEEALILLTAKDAQAGEQIVVLGNRHSGVMIHEAVGHPLEADSNWKKSSIMWDKMGKMVANPIVTIYDDATIPNYRGSMNIDDEGTETRNVMLIEKGKLVGYMNDKLAARIMKSEPNGHGRRESYQSPPIPRMNNTILGKGDKTPEEIISSVKKGFYADTFQGGQVMETGKFTFSVNLGYMIEDGKLTQPLKNSTLIGTNIAILQDIDMIADDTAFFLGTCGKDGQSAAVTAGTPTLRIRKMTVGGVA
jgi:TldD protein